MNGEDPPRKNRKLHTYEKARLAFERIQREKREKQQRFQERQKERQEAIANARKSRKQHRKFIYNRNRNGQPHLGLQVKYLLQKIEKQVASKKS